MPTSQQLPLIIASVVVFGFISAQAAAQSTEAVAIQTEASFEIPQLTETSESQATRLKWFRDAKFGLFIHWGPATISGEEISWGMAGRIEGGEHHKKVPRETYMNLYQKFNPVNFDADQIMSLAEGAGMKYVVFVAKHHDGFCLWPTAQKRFPEGADYPTNYSIADTPYKGNPVRMIQQAAKKQGLKLGWYYSTRDWTHPEYLKGDKPEDNAAYNDYYENQVEELLNDYGPVDIMWFDHTFGKWDQYTIPGLFEKMYAIRPDLLVNNRAAKGLKEFPKEYLPILLGDFDTPENRMGAFQHGRAWESCMILSPHPDHGGWSYRPDSVTRSLTETIQLLSSCVTGDGNMLLNIAPLPDGSIKPEEQAILEGIAPWMEQYGDAVYGTRGGPWINGPWGGSTHKGKTVYLHVFEAGDDPIELNALPQQVISATTMDGTSIPFSLDESGKHLSVTIPKDARDPHVSVVKLTLAENVAGVMYGPALANAEANEVPGTLRFNPSNAKITGETLKVVESGEEAALANWIDPKNTASWPLEIDSPGTYSIQLTSSAVKAGSTLAVICGNKKTFYVHVPGTGSFKNYQTYEVGKFTFPNAEKLQLMLRPVDRATWSPIQVKSVKMTPGN